MNPTKSVFEVFPRIALSCFMLGVFVETAGCFHERPANQPQLSTAEPADASKTPLAGRRGFEFTCLSNGMVLFGDRSLPFRANLHEYDDVYFVVNGGVSPMGVEVDSGTNGQRVVHWDTESFPNGLYDVYLRADSEYDRRSYFSATNSIIVSNWISFDSWPVYGTQMWVFARLAVPHADWKAKVSDARGNYVGFFTGRTTNGLINFIWDLTDAKGMPVTNRDSIAMSFSFKPVGDAKPVIPLVHPDPMQAPQIETDPIPRRIQSPE